MGTGAVLLIDVVVTVVMTRGALVEVDVEVVVSVVEAMLLAMGDDSEDFEEEEIAVPLNARVGAAAPKPRLVRLLQLDEAAAGIADRVCACPSIRKRKKKVQ